jgi:hypothetical protein
VRGDGGGQYLWQQVVCDRVMQCRCAGVAVAAVEGWGSQPGGLLLPGPGTLLQVARWVPRADSVPGSKVSAVCAARGT